MARNCRPDIPEILIRAGAAPDLGAVERLQKQAPEAAQWPPADYLAYDFRLADCEAELAGFAVARTVASDEAELLNLVVAPEFRRCGVATRLLQDLAARHPGTVFLEVRESNDGARNFYYRNKFIDVAIRKNYYRHPVEDAIVMLRTLPEVPA